MPTLGAPLDFAKLEGRNFRGHLLGTAPAAPVTGQLYFNTGDNTLYWYDGTAWVSARGGVAAVPDASTSVKGIVQLAGDLAGTAASPQIAAGVITDAEVAAANKDGAAGTPSLRTLGTTTGKAMDGLTRLDTIAAPTGSVNLNSQKIIGLGVASNGGDAVNKAYVDSIAQGLDVKQSCKAATTPAGGNITLSGAQTVDGVALVAGDRCLVKNQAGPNGWQNGIYDVASGAWTRSADFDTSGEMPGGFCFVENGTQADTGWVCTNGQGVVVGTDSIVFQQFSGTGEYQAGNGLTITGTQFDVGAGTGISVAADTVGIANGGVNTGQIAAGAINLNTGAGLVSGTLAISNGGTGNTTTKAARESGLGATGRWMQNTHGAGTTISIPQSTHGLRADSGLIVQCQIAATGAVVWPDVQVAANGDVTVTFAVSQSASTIQVVIIG